MAIERALDSLARNVQVCGRLVLGWKRRLRASALRGHARGDALEHEACSVLAVANNGIGNTVECTPLIQGIKAFWPRSTISVLTRFPELFENWCVVDSVGSSVEDLGGSRFTHTFVAWGSGIGDFRSRIDPGHVHRIGCLGGIPVRPEREYNMGMIRQLGYRGPTPPLYVAVRSARGAVPAASRRICLAVGGLRSEKWRSKHWPYFAELCDALCADYPQVHVCLVGGPEDKAVGTFPERVNLVDLRGVLALPQTAWVLKRSDLVIGNDCGPMHIADAVGARALVIFGPTCEIKNGPRHSGRAIRLDLACRPCQYGNSESIASCEERRCMTELSVDTVSEIASTLLTDVQGA